LIRLVLDTNIVLSGLFWDGPPRKLLAPNPSEFVLYTSAPLIEELEDVLGRRKFASRIALSPAPLHQLVEKYVQSTTLVIPRHVPRIAADSPDDVVIGTALAANADLIVTGDHGLLSVSQYHNIRIVSVAEALQLTTSD
jgi:putative PIN family toxin of toxin-antitoxin system